MFLFTRDSANKFLAAANSNHTVGLFDYGACALKGIQNISAHKNVISGVRFGKAELDLLFTSSFDGTVKCWDTRTNMKKAAQTFEGYGETNNVFTSFDISSNDRVLCAGTESLKQDCDIHILFWDRRQSSLMGAYNQSHQDDVTQVCFHPNNVDSLATGSTDGLVCVFDIAQPTEDDALQLTLNSESSVARIGWCGEEQRNLFCLTHIDTLCVWDTQNDGEDIKILNDLKETLKGSDAVEYLVDCFDANNSLFVATGTHSGDIRLVDISGETPTVASTLSGGHNSTVRVAHWDSKTNSLVTGGEDSCLCLWSKDSQLTDRQTASIRKLKSKRKSGLRKKSKPY